MSRLPLQNPRNRTINFRLTEPEYEAVRHACGAARSRCLSDFARDAVLSQVQGAPEPAEPLPALDDGFKLPNVVKRLRIVTFRVSDEEFQALRALHLETGSSSVSDLARSALERYLTQYIESKQNGVLAERLENLSARVAAINAKLNFLNGRLGAPEECAADD